MVAQVKDLLSSYNLLDKLITYVKDKDGQYVHLCISSYFNCSCGLLGLVVPW